MKFYDREKEIAEPGRLDALAEGSKAQPAQVQCPSPRREIPIHPEKKHGLFTYFLLKKLQTTKGKVSLNELSEFVKTSVTRKSLVENGKSQTPSVYVSLGLQDKWKNIKLK